MSTGLNSDGGHQVIVSRLQDRQRASLIMIPVLALVGVVFIVISADGIKGDYAMFIAGVVSCHSAITMIVAWGAASGHAQLARYSHNDHVALYDRLSDRVGTVETFEREQIRLLGSLADQVEAARKHRRMN